MYVQAPRNSTRFSFKSVHQKLKFPFQETFLKRSKISIRFCQIFTPSTQMIFHVSVSNRKTLVRKISHNAELKPKITFHVRASTKFNKIPQNITKFNIFSRPFSLRNHSNYLPITSTTPEGGCFPLIRENCQRSSSWHEEGNAD